MVVQGTPQQEETAGGMRPVASNEAPALSVSSEAEIQRAQSHLTLVSHLFSDTESTEFSGSTKLKRQPAALSVLQGSKNATMKLRVNSVSRFFLITGRRQRRNPGSFAFHSPASGKGGTFRKNEAIMLLILQTLPFFIGRQSR